MAVCVFSLGGSDGCMAVCAFSLGGSGTACNASAIFGSLSMNLDSLCLMGSFGACQNPAEQTNPNTNLNKLHVILRM